MVGAGLIGARVARLLAGRGDEVAVASRRGTALAGTEALTMDASDAAALTRAAAGASTILLCSGPAAYTAKAWQQDWPPVYRAAIAAARDSGAALVVMGNLYPYGVQAAPFTEHSPELTTSAKGLVRKAGWAAVKAAHDRGELRAVEVRASDYFGAGLGGTAHLGERFFAAIRASKAAPAIGNQALPHSWSYLDDIAATLAAAAGYEGEWGRIWHVPSGVPHSRDEIATALNELYGSRGRVRGVPTGVLKALGLFSSQWKGIADEAYQFTNPWVIDATETEQLLGVSATPWEQALRETAASYGPLAAVAQPRAGAPGSTSTR